MKNTKKILSALATSAILINAFATPAFAAATLQISGNGADSSNAITQTTTTTNTIAQTNSANISNTVNVSGNTGNNDANKNTGGDVMVTTGDSKVGVKVDNLANSNSASVACCSTSGDTIVKLLGNGADSVNTADLTNTKTNVLTQGNDATVANDITANAGTGKNKANENTGGDVSVDTGNATVGVVANTTVNKNAASVGCCDSATTKAIIANNGADSTSTLGLTNDSSNSIYQTNSADVANGVEANAYTGKNDANKNTNGSVSVSTGDATSSVNVATTANVNMALVGDPTSAPSAGTVLADIFGNGADSSNNIDLLFSKDNTISQDNAAEITNTVSSDAKTGKNKANENTGGDVTVDTGNANSMLGVTNKVNFNWADVGCCDFTLTADISDNGAGDPQYSGLLGFDIPVLGGNNISSAQSDSNLVLQGNDAGLANSLTGQPSTGKNDANSNTADPFTFNDPVDVSTGNSMSVNQVSNSGNVNTEGTQIPTTWPDFSFTFNLGSLGSMFGMS